MFTQAAVNQHIVYDILILYFIAIGLTRPLFKDYLLKFVINLGIKPKNHLHIDSETFHVLDDLERYKYIFVIFQIIQSAIWRNIDSKANADSISTSLSTTLWNL